MPITVPAAAVRLYSRHKRHSIFARLRYARQALAFLDTQANRLAGGTTVAELFGVLENGYTAEQVEDAVNRAAIGLT